MNIIEGKDDTLKVQTKYFLKISNIGGIKVVVVYRSVSTSEQFWIGEGGIDYKTLTLEFHD